MNQAQIIGIYSVALAISTSSSIILFSINSIAAPKFSKLFSSRNMEEFKSFVKLSSRLIFWFSLPIIMFIIINSEFLLGIFGNEFKNGKLVLLILLFGQFINILCGSVGYILMMTNKQNLLLNIIIFSAILNIILNIILIPIYGIMGAAVASTISMICWNLIAMIYVYKEYGFITTSIIK